MLQRFINSLKIRPARLSVRVEPGLYHYEYLQKEWPTRFHLRIDPDGQGLLLADATEAALCLLSPKSCHTCSIGGRIFVRSLLISGCFT